MTNTIGPTPAVLSPPSGPSSWPSMLFTAAACAHRDIRGLTLVTTMVTSAAYFALYQYVFDTSNQATGADEDLVNKRHRPVPCGLITSRGLLGRFWCAMPAYTLLGWLTGTLAWTLLWQTTVIGFNLLARPRDYLWAKPVAMVLGTIAMLAGAWELAAPLDAVAWSWILVITVGFNLSLRFEDVRDMAGMPGSAATPSR
ncbi:hypothetical protein [Streptomyces sp. UG1]|uniref:hypothetical protein n=1 Tax=Streptomyces sp. UG1 TaxID=3417652 RepID=UPI003CECBF52